MTDLKAQAFDEAFFKRFNRKVETSWNVFAGSSGSYVTRPIGFDQLSEEQTGWLEGWADRTLAA